MPNLTIYLPDTLTAELDALCAYFRLGKSGTIQFLIAHASLETTKVKGK